jgi:hypothetical protein
MTKNKQFDMAGTEGTHEYIVLAETERGALGYRELGGSFRVRVEPAQGHAAELSADFPRVAGWKQPGDSGQQRFSLVVHNGAALKDALVRALGALLGGEAAVNLNVPTWALKLTVACEQAAAGDREALVRTVQELGLPGHGIAGNWTAPTLRGRVVGSLTVVPRAEDHAALVAEVREAKVAGANLAPTWSFQTLRSKVA